LCLLVDAEQFGMTQKCLTNNQIIMRTFKIFIAIIALSVGAAKAQFTKAELQVSGLTCSMCSKATEKSLRTLDFISDIKADLNRNLFIITFKKQPVNLDLISQKVQKAGFSVNNLKATFDFNNVKVTNNYHFNYAGNLYHFINVSDKTLNGPVAITVIDKGFVASPVYKKYAGQIAAACYKAGKMGDSRVYHVTI
jgi:copper chaperone CopZ